MALDPEDLTYWYFRLNGFFTIPKFVVHPDHGGRQRTDIDVLGIRLPHRRELSLEPMVDDHVFTNVGDKAFVAITEVKMDVINFNQTWLDSEQRNVERILFAAGPFAPERVANVAQEIYARGCFVSDDFYHVSLVGVGRRKNIELQGVLPGALQITWTDIGRFVFCRFCHHSDQKRDHPQWDETGRQLWNMWRQNEDDEEGFCAAVLREVTQGQ